jgi:hypothetical protein
MNSRLFGPNSPCQRALPPTSTPFTRLQRQLAAAGIGLERFTRRGRGARYYVSSRGAADWASTNTLRTAMLTVDCWLRHPGCSWREARAQALAVKRAMRLPAEGPST